MQHSFILCNFFSVNMLDIATHLGSLFFSGADSMPCAQYEFPNGFHRDFGEERIRIPEMLFDPSFIKVCFQIYIRLCCMNFITQ